MASRSSKLLTMLSVLSTLATIALILIVLQMIQRMSDGANALDVAKTEQSINAAVTGILEQSANLMADNARWDDAVENAYGETNPEWLFDSWGSTSSDSNYDTSFVIDENGKTIAAFTLGKAFDGNADSYVGPALQRMVATLPMDGKSTGTATAFTTTPKGLSVVAVAPIVNYEQTDPIPSTRARLLVFARTLKQEEITSLGQRLIVSGLSLSPAKPFSGPSAAIRDDAGTDVGYLTWTPDRPGDMAKSKIKWPAILGLGGMVACILMFAILSWQMSTKLQRSEVLAWGIANRDVLTGLPNRHAALALLEEKLKPQKVPQVRNLVVMITDLDGFKEVNDTYGHHIGDNMIQGVAAGMRMITDRFGATLSRLGGDEFAVILDGDGAMDKAKEIARAALAFLVEPFNIDGRIARVGMSIGIASDGADEVTGAEMLRRADVAMYASKEEGKNRCTVYEPRLDAERRSRIAMARALTQTLAANELEVAFQPIVEAGSQKITGVEALARWQKFDGQYIPPDEFIAVAEEFGLIDQLGKQVLSVACRQAAQWPGIKLSVNISPAQFRNPNFVADVIAIVDASGLPRARLELELTEGYLIEQKDRAKPILEALRANGIHIALDDFGTGYSSIGYLREYHFNRLKIDRSLIHNMTTDNSSGSIIQATTVLARSMGMTVTAEGVELAEEASLLRLAGCDSLQGYFFGRPQPAAAITAMLEGHADGRAVA